MGRHDGAAVQLDYVPGLTSAAFFSLRQREAPSLRPAAENSRVAARVDGGPALLADGHAAWPCNAAGSRHADILPLWPDRRDLYN
jgi:hypothetical protein